MSKRNADVSVETVDLSMVERRLAEALAASGDRRDAISRVADLAAKGTNGADAGWSLLNARLAYAASVENVFGDTRSAEGKATYLMTPTEYGSKYGAGVSGSRVAVWVRAGRMLSVGANVGSVKQYMRKPGDYDVETLDAALKRGRIGAQTFTRAAQVVTDKREAKKAEREAAKRAEQEAASKGEATVKAEGGKATVAGPDLIAVIVSATASTTVETFRTYVATHGTDTLSGVFDVVAEWLTTGRALIESGDLVEPEQETADVA